VCIWTAIALSVIATCCYQVGQVMQKIGADRMPRLQSRVCQGRDCLARRRTAKRFVAVGGELDRLARGRGADVSLALTASGNLP